MSAEQDAEELQIESPDPSSHATNAYDTIESGGEIDELDDDDMDFEPTSDDSEDVEFLDADGDGEEFHGMTSWLTCPTRSYRKHGKG